MESEYQPSTWMMTVWSIRNTLRFGIRGQNTSSRQAGNHRQVRMGPVPSGLVDIKEDRVYTKTDEDKEWRFGYYDFEELEEDPDANSNPNRS